MVEHPVARAALRPSLKPVPRVAVGEFVQLVAVVEHQSSAVEGAEGVAPAPTADAGGTRGECAQSLVGLAGRAAEAIWIHGPWHMPRPSGPRELEAIGHGRLLKTS